MIEPKEEAGGECDSRQEGVSASIVTSVDTSPVLEAAKHVFDAVALSVEGAIVRDERFTVDFRRDAGGDASLGKRFAEPVGVISAVGEHGGGWRQGVDQQGGALVVAGLSLGEHQADGTAAAVAYGMELGGQPAAAAPDTAG